jgi:hypothetical protein
MENNNNLLDNTLSELLRKEKMRKRNVIIWALLSIFIIAFIILYLMNIDTIYIKNNDLTLKNDLLVKELDETSKSMVDTSSYTLIDSIQIKKILDSVTGKRKKAIELAFEYQKQHTQFKWGGKKPSEGFDTSGFIAYILSQVGIIEKPETYWSGKLRTEFLINENRIQKQLIPGDLIFEANKACWFYLNDKYTIGMVPGGIMIGEPAKFTSEIIGYGKVPY